MSGLIAYDGSLRREHHYQEGETVIFNGKRDVRGY